MVPLIDFLIHEWLDVDELLTRPRFAQHSRGSIDDLVTAASDIAGTYFEPAHRPSDLVEPYVAGDVAVLPEQTRAAWNAYRDFGFLAAAHDEEHGGMQVPRVADLATRAIFHASAASVSPALLTDANASLILKHGTEVQKRVFAETELIGRWTGTMAMSESQAGSSLSDVATRATPDGEDFQDDPLGHRYRVVGQKMWISNGENDLGENIIHLVLAKIPGPDGTVDPSTRGLSLFIVPKFVVDEDARIVERNDVTLVGLNHKLGMRGTANTALAFGDGGHEPGGRRGAIGYLVGEPGRGLAQMFHMMNAARTEIGLLGAAVGFAGFAVSLDYAKQRHQGRHPQAVGKVADSPQVAIVEHADVKRMLLAQKAFAEGALSLCLYAARLLDEQQTGEPADAARATRLLEILTPVVKSWPAEWCLEANSLAIQVLGGAGYTRDFPVEQYWRDQRLNMIHEGTHAIHGLDLLGRKVLLDDGALLADLHTVVNATGVAARTAGLVAEADDLLAAWSHVRETTDAAWSTGDPRDALANATPYLQGFGHVVVAWILLDVAVAASRSRHSEAPGKLAAMRYFYAYELPKIGAWLDVAGRREPLCRDLPLSEL
ncbi:acyl-CoA dehydrogenase [Aeromicrobium endophyticum]|uniref:Acyl-CoA dehydrogenase n=1 Tax=Aeromicrobium endophyticum TaxID=2292704 RepID=A0A371NZG7_9ACTN|nr:acyl-CoA dehydrogenase [Aeromicrobium endophyticum]